MLQSSRGQRAPIRARLKIDMLIDGEQYKAGDVVEMNHRDFKYLEQYERVEIAPAPVKTK